MCASKELGTTPQCTVQCLSVHVCKCNRVADHLGSRMGTKFCLSVHVCVSATEMLTIWAVRWAAGSFCLCACV